LLVRVAFGAERRAGFFFAVFARALFFFCFAISRCLPESW
jgi:hypothetical protein